MSKLAGVVKTQLHGPQVLSLTSMSDCVREQLYKHKYMLLKCVMSLVTSQGTSKDTTMHAL